MTAVSKNVYFDLLDDIVNRPGIFSGKYHVERKKISLCSLVRYIIKGSKKQRWVVWEVGIAKISHKTEVCLQQLKILR